QAALITKNRMRVDLIGEFFVRVGAGRELVAAAAQTLGRRTLQPEGVRELLEGKFTAAMRTVAAQMSLEEMHERRSDYAQRVREIASESLALTGWSWRAWRSSISTRPASNISIRRTPSTRKA